jgi:hypothetical protein
MCAAIQIWGLLGRNQIIGGMLTQPGGKRGRHTIGEEFDDLMFLLVRDRCRRHRGRAQKYRLTARYVEVLTWVPMQ